MEIKNNYTILAVDDAKDTLMLLDFDLTNEGYQVVTVDSGDKALKLLSTSRVNDTPIGYSKIDLVLLDMYMPGLSGLSVLEKIKNTSETANVPVIMLSASNDEDEIVNALELGADDYVTKPYIAKVLLARMRTSLRLKEKTQQLEHLAQTDFLTSINNRGSFYQLSLMAISQCKRHKQRLAVAMFDIDFFKKVNDDFGHDAGDKVLIEFAKMLTSSFREYDVVARIGGEEFAVCMPNTSIENAMMCCERFRKTVENQQIIIDEVKQQSISITVSIGLVSELLGRDNDDIISIDSLLKLADQCLYKSKNNGRNQVVTYEIEPSVNVLHGVNLMNEDMNKSEDNIDVSSSLILPGIDYDIGVANVLGDDELYKEILVMFYEDHANDGDKLHKAIISNEKPSTKHLAHTLKGVACSIGAMDLFERTKELDNAINNDVDTSEIESLFTEGVAPELLKVFLGIKLYLNL